ncbi:MAG: LPS export ABC transporter periplasmic protein LptC [Bacteroidetes bacterium]|nr:LPS export ABC transporter periplasmic protein LptC [Bacteroidota bacterium]
MIILFILFSANIFAQDKVELIHADSLTGKNENGVLVREAQGNVQFKQGNITVFCNSATQYPDQNKVDLRGNVKIYQDTLSLFTSKGIYYGNEKRATGEGGVTLKDPNATLRANSGVYFFDQAKADFHGDVIIINPQYKITSTDLTYLRNTEDSFAKGNVIVTTDSAIIKAENINFYKRQFKTFAWEKVVIDSDSTLIYSDTLTHYSDKKESYAAGNVKVNSLNNNTILYGNILENYELKNYTKLAGKSKLVQIDKTTPDTLYIYSSYMEAFRTKPEYYIATDSVEIIRTNFYSKCGRGIYFKDSSKVAMEKEPIVWQDNMQITGDSIYAELPGNKLQSIFVKKLNIPNTKPSFMISQGDSSFADRFDQIRSRDISVYIQDDKVDSIKAISNASSIYFIYEEKKANGVNNSEGDNIYIYFDRTENTVSKIRIEKGVKGVYSPETDIGKVTLTLPGFIPRNDKPIRR